MAKDAQSIKRSLYTGMSITLLVAALVFGYYLWNGTVIHEENTSNPGTSQVGPYRMRFSPSASLSVEQAGNGAVIGTVKLTNLSGQKLLLPDTVTLEPLFSIVVRYSDGKENSMALLPRRGSSNVTTLNGALVKFDESKDAVVELIPGSTISRSFPLTPLFDLQKPGHYEVTVQYRPTNVVAADADSLPAFNVNTVNCSVSFDVPSNSTKDALAPRPEAGVSSVK